MKKKVLHVIGTSHFDLYDLCDALPEHRADCIVRQWNQITDAPGHYDLAVLFGLTPNAHAAHRYAGTVRAAIGPGTKFLIVSHWAPSVMAAVMKERYDAEYFSRHGPILHLIDTVLKMLDEAKTAPYV